MQLKIESDFQRYQKCLLLKTLDNRLGELQNCLPEQPFRQYRLKPTR